MCRFLVEQIFKSGKFINIFPLFPHYFRENTLYSMKRRGQRKRDATDTTRRDMGGDNFKESMIKNEDVDEDEDEECQCGNGAGCCPKSGWIACCCCCKIRTRYIPDLVCLVFLLTVAAVQIHIPFSIMGLPVGFILVR